MQKYDYLDLLLISKSDDESSFSSEATLYNTVEIPNGINASSECATCRFINTKIKIQRDLCGVLRSENLCDEM